MFAFVFLDPLFKYLGRAGGTENPVIVKANSHSYRASELIAIVQSRQMVKNFLQRLAVEWVQKEVEANHIPPRDAGSVAEATFERWHQELMNRFVPPDEMPSDDDDTPRQESLSAEEAAAVQTLVLAAAAEQHGMMVTDQAVNDYLEMITRNLISPAEFEKIVGSLHGDSRNMSQALLFDSLRREILASRYSFMYQVSLASVLPAPRWEYFQKLNRRADAETVGVAVEGFVKDVPEPSEAELKAFFDKYRDVLPVPNSPTPGFKRPAKAMFQYFLAHPSEFTEKALAQVTPEEIREYYEKNKDVRFRERKVETAPGNSGDSDAEPDGTKAGAAQSDDKQPSDSSAAPGASSKGSDQTPKAGGDGPRKPATGSPPATPADGGKKSSRSVPASALHLVALAQKEDAKTPAAAPADAKADAAPAATGTDEKPAADAAEEKSGDSGEASPDAAAVEKASGKKAVVYEPLEKVEDEIRKAIATEKANRQIDEIFQRLSTKMREYSSARGEYEVRKEEDPDLEEPEPLDLAALANAEGVSAKETDLVSADELQADTDIGKSFSFFLDPRSRMGYREVTFPEIGFADRRFKPAITEDSSGDRYLSWKVKETPTGVPDFDAVRKEVVRALKLVEARKLAVAAAQKLAKEAREVGKPLSEDFAGREGLEVVKTDWFTWMTTGNTPFDPGANQPRLSDVHGVQSPGDDFMEAVFNSTPDQISVALNESKTVAYVIQVKAFEPALSDLRQEFLLEDFRKYARLAMNDEQTQYVQWLRWLDRQAGVTWLNPGFTSRRASD
ncbi:MAG TPA: hypothetical protein VHY91_20025 [Pirellulales bacterium]|nr:hypothetical protein [Pirellulales bacterium]